MKIRFITTDMRNQSFLREDQEQLMEKPNQFMEMELISLFPQYRYQEVLGFGGAFTDASAYLYSKMSPQKQEEIVKAYFDVEKGLAYNFTRVSINSCDFSSCEYSCVEDVDKELSTFHIKHDMKYVIPMIHAAQKVSDFKVFASPWSPPSFMKDNGETKHGGHLLKEYYSSWANYFKKFIKAYKEQNIDIFAVTVQNEPMSAQTWESCQFTPEEEKAFVVSYLADALKETGTRIMCWDHNKQSLCDVADTFFGDAMARNLIWGLAFHWYSGDHFEQIRMVSEKYPEKKLIFSEGCKSSPTVGIKSEIEQLSFAECYAHEIIGDFANGACAFTDWNLMLDMENGPFHDRLGTRYCDAPLLLDPDKNQIHYGVSYYYIGHFSRYIKEGAVRIGMSRYTDKIESIAFQNPDKSIAAVMLNRSSEKVRVYIQVDGFVCKREIAPHSIVTALIS